MLQQTHCGVKLFLAKVALMFFMTASMTGNQITAGLGRNRDDTIQQRSLGSVTVFIFKSMLLTYMLQQILRSVKYFLANRALMCLVTGRWLLAANCWTVWENIETINRSPAKISAVKMWISRGKNQTLCEDQQQNPSMQYLIKLTLQCLRP